MANTSQSSRAAPLRTVNLPRKRNSGLARTASVPRCGGRVWPLRLGMRGSLGFAGERLKTFWQATGTRKLSLPPPKRNVPLENGQRRFTFLGCDFTGAEVEGSEV